MSVSGTNQIAVIPAKAGICRTGCANVAERMDARERSVDTRSARHDEQLEYVRYF